MRTSAFATLAAAGLFATHTQGAVLFSEDFESYTDTAAMGTVWALGDGTLDATGGAGGSKGLSHPGTGGSFSGGNTNLINFGSVIGTSAGDPLTGIRITYKLVDDGASNKRISLGLRDGTAGGTGEFFELGLYNQLNANGAAARIANFFGASPTPAGSGSWDTIGPNASQALVAGTHTFIAEITLTSLRVAVDELSNGSVDYEDIYTFGSQETQFGQVRLGGPSDVSSLGGGVVFDDILIESYLIPEPASIALLGSGVAFIARRRRA